MIHLLHDAQIEKFCAANESEYIRFNRSIPMWVLSSGRILASTLVVLGLFSVLNWAKHGPMAGLAYLPTMLIAALFPVVNHLLGPRMYRWALLYLEVGLASLVCGMLLVVQQALWFQNQLVNAPVQFVLLCVGMLSFHTDLRHTFIRNLLLFGLSIVFLYVVDEQFLLDILMQFPAAFLPAVIVNVLVHRQIQVLFYIQQTNVRARQHAYGELTKLVYPHQVEQVQVGQQLEDTMPIGTSEGFSLCLDIIQSTKIKHPRFAAALRAFRGRALDLMMDGYTAQPLRSSAFRLQETGDGFMCTIGFPFAPPEGHSPGEVVLALVPRFLQEFDRLMRDGGVDLPIRCCIGVSYGPLIGYFTEGRVRHYDITGLGIVLSVRYQEMRKLLPSLDCSGAHLVLLSHTALEHLPEAERLQFQTLELGDVSVRDDPDARVLHYRHIPLQRPPGGAQ